MVVLETVFQRTELPCMRMALSEVQNVEVTQEIRVPDDLPDVGSIVSAWGQVIARGKEWRSESVRINGGMMVWVLYLSEDGEGAFCLDTWIPFQADWMLPEGTPEGTIAVTPLTRFVDARSVSPKRIMIRAGAGILGEIMCPERLGIFDPKGNTDGIELLRTRHSVRVPKEAGEKTFDLEGTSPDGKSAGKPVYYTAGTEISEQKVLANKIAFRGNCVVHVLYAEENGNLMAEDIAIPFSQIAELKGSHGSDAQVLFRMCVTNLEMEPNPDEEYTVKCSISGQYIVDDLVEVETVEDAYSPGRIMNLERDEIDMPKVVEYKMQNVIMEQEISAEASEILDTTILPDFPKQFKDGDKVSLEIPGTVQVLYRTDSGSLKSGTARWEVKTSQLLSQDERLTVIPGSIQEPRVSSENGTVNVHGELPLQLCRMGVQDILVITGLEIGEDLEPDPQRPSMILKRPGKSSLWELAKSCGSTIDAIRKANNLQEEPKPGQVLLIPVL